MPTLQNLQHQVASSAHQSPSSPEQGLQRAPKAAGQPPPAALSTAPAHGSMLSKLSACNSAAAGCQHAFPRKQRSSRNRVYPSQGGHLGGADASCRTALLLMEDTIFSLQSMQAPLTALCLAEKEHLSSQNMCSFRLTACATSASLSAQCPHSSGALSAGRCSLHPLKCSLRTKCSSSAGFTTCRQTHNAFTFLLSAAMHFEDIPEICALWHVPELLKRSLSTSRSGCTNQMMNG